MTIESVKQYQAKESLIAALKVMALGEKDRLNGQGISAAQSRVQLAAAAARQRRSNDRPHTPRCPSGVHARPMGAGPIDSGLLTGSRVQALSVVGIFEYQNVLTSRHKLVYRRIDGDVYVYAIAEHQQDFPTLLMKRMLRI